MCTLKMIYMYSDIYSALVFWLNPLMSSSAYIIKLRMIKLHYNSIGIWIIRKHWWVRIVWISGNVKTFLKILTNFVIQYKFYFWEVTSDECSLKCSCIEELNSINVTFVSLRKKFVISKWLTLVWHKDPKQASQEM